MQSQKYCTKCGSPIEPGVKFCTRCGTPVAQAAEEGEAEDSTAGSSTAEEARQPEDAQDIAGTPDAGSQQPEDEDRPSGPVEAVGQTAVSPTVSEAPPASDEGAPLDEGGTPAEGGPAGGEASVQAPEAPKGGSWFQTHRKQAIVIIAVVAVAIIGLIAFMAYRGSVAKGAKDAVSQTSQSIADADGSLAKVDAYMDPDGVYSAYRKTDDMTSGINDANSSLDDAQGHLDSAKGGSWALDQGDKDAVDKLQACIDARRGMTDSATTYAGELKSLDSLAQSIQDFKSKLKTVTDKMSAAIAIENQTNNIDAIDTDGMSSNLREAEDALKAAKDDLDSVSKASANADLGKYQKAYSECEKLLKDLQTLVDAIKARDVNAANSAANAFNTDRALANVALLTAPSVNSVINSLVTPAAKDAATAYDDAKGRAKDALEQLKDYSPASPLYQQSPLAES